MILTLTLDPMVEQLFPASWLELGTRRCDRQVLV